MHRETAKKIFCSFFVSIFFMKMVISAVPLFYSFKSDTVRAVIMQLEIEEKSDSKSPEKGKELEIKEYCTELFDFSFDLPLNATFIKPLTEENKLHIQSFYPPVPTPPPNC